jgi:serine/threonine protein kinase
MAVVYRAEQESLQRLVAIKVLKREHLREPQVFIRFQREALSIAALQHENIVHIYDYWKKPNYAIVMEYVDGTTLADVIDKTGALPIDVGIMIAIQVSSALDYAHMRGLVHRDIKPGNIMIKRNGEVKLMDFGIAHTRNLEALTLPGTLIGTPSYMSPEQILGQELDVRSDIFSFGIVLYEMFTGTKPFTDDDTRAVTAKIMKDSFLSPRRVNSEIPWRLQWLIKKCLRKKPKRRYGSMLEVEKKLGRRLAGRTTKASSLQRIAAYLVSMNVFEAAPEQETMIVTTKVPLIARFRTALVSAVLLLVLAGGAGGYYAWMTSKDSPAQYPAVQPMLPSTTTSLSTRPQQTIPGVPGASSQDTPVSSLSTTRSAPTVSAVSSSISTTDRTSSASSVSAQQTKKETPPTGKKTTKGKKKKKVTADEQRSR